MDEAIKKLEELHKLALELIEQIEMGNYECLGGYLVNNVAYVAFKEQVERC